jgi:hypothetical protein
VEPIDCDDFWTPVVSLAVDPQNSDSVYAAGSGGVFKSTDAGATFKSLDSVLSAYLPCELGSTNCYDPYTTLSLAIDPQHSNNVYIVLGGGVLRSTDGGASWTSINTGLPKFSGWTLNPWTLAFDPTDAHILYLATNDDGIYSITLQPEEPPRSRRP